MSHFDFNRIVFLSLFLSPSLSIFLLFLLVNLQFLLSAQFLSRLKFDLIHGRRPFSKLIFFMFSFLSFFRFGSFDFVIFISFNRSSSAPIHSLENSFSIVSKLKFALFFLYFSSSLCRYRSSKSQSFFDCNRCCVCWRFSASTFVHNLSGSFSK